jgi:EF-hand domain pair/EF hand
MTTKFLPGTLLATLALLAAGFAQAQTTEPVAPAAPAAPMAPMAKTKSAKPMKLDANGDGYVSREEAQGHKGLATRFDAADTDKDARLSSAELKALHDSMPPKPGKEPKAPKAGKAPAFNTLDTNADQMLSRDEVAQHPKLAKRFDQVDANKDGQVSADEFATAKAARAK